jgi:metal-sulfur cluster biosynthetic enzyme
MITPEAATPDPNFKDDVSAVLSNVLDPELGIDIVALGLVYCIEIDGSRVDILMTLTVPGCPMSASIKDEVEAAVRSLFWVTAVNVKLTFDPPWRPDRLTPQARRQLAR